MKIGMNLLLWTGGVTAEHFPLLGKLKAAGFDGVELPVFGGSPADYKPIRAELDKHGLKCTTVTILTKETNAISPDAATRQKAVDWLKTVVEINHILGAETRVRAVPLGHRRVLRHRADRGREEALGRRAADRRGVREASESHAGDRVPQPLRVLLPQHRGRRRSSW